MANCIKCGSKSAVWSICNKEKVVEHFCDPCFKKFNLHEYKKEMDDFHRKKEEEKLKNNAEKSRKTEVKYQMLKDVILIVDTKTVQWLKGKSRNEMIGFALNSCEVIADDVWPNIKSWMQASSAVPSIFSMQGTWDKSKCAKVVHETKPAYKNLAIAVRTGTTGFGGEIAIALCTDDS